jgi:virginiamycin B lyase
LTLPVPGAPRAWSDDREGRIWLTVQDPDALVCIDPRAPDPEASIVVIEASLLQRPDGIWRGDDGGIWFANSAANSIGRIDPSAADPGDSLEAFGAPPDVDGPFDIKDGPDGWLWFTNKTGNTMGRIYAGASNVPV